MKLNRTIRQARKLAKPYRVTDGRRFYLRDVDPADTGPLDAADKPRGREMLERGSEAMSELQDLLYAFDRWSLLLVFQAMDAGGKDGAIKHVMSGVNPQGCQVASFKAPSAEELDHDFLWRCVRHLPEHGRIGIFNRSYYEEVLVVRVHGELLERQRIPRLVGKGIWKERYESIRDFERHLTRNGTVIRKFFLHVSRDEQKQRFIDRLDRPEKHWKFSASDVAERRHWHAYMEAYENMVRHTATPEAPWYVVPADHKWFTRTVVAAAIVDALASLDLKYPQVGKARLTELEAARAGLVADNGR